MTYRPKPPPIGPMFAFLIGIAIGLAILALAVRTP